MRFQQENSLKMASDYEGGSSSPSFVLFGRSILSMKRGTTLPITNLHHSHTRESTTTTHQEQELEAFQIHVTQSFINLSSSSFDDQFLSLVWLSNLLDTFLSCQHNFYTILFNHKSYITTTDKLILDYLERSVKGLDICNSIRDGIQQMGLWQKQLEIVSSCVLLSDQKNLAQAQLRRAKKATKELQVLMMLDDKESSSSAAAAFAHRNRSFQKDQKSLMKQFRSMSWSVSRSWSASKQLEAIGNNIVPPKANNIINSLAMAVYTMSNVLLFVMWALVATIPCQDGGPQTHFNTSALKSFTWGPPIVGLHDRIMEESKKRRGRRSNANCGLLKEIQVIERSVDLVNKLFEIPVGEGKEEEEQVRRRVEEVVTVCDALKNGLDPLEKKVRQVFHGIVRTRAQGLDSIAFSRG